MKLIPQKNDIKNGINSLYGSFFSDGDICFYALLDQYESPMIPGSGCAIWGIIRWVKPSPSLASLTGEGAKE